MPIFEDAIKQGQQNYLDAARAKQEIDDVFAALSAELEAATDGRVKATFGKFSRSKPQAPQWSVALPLVDSEEYLALAIVRVGGDKRATELCDVQVGPFGYPVQLTFPGQFLEAFDRKGLEAALRQLVQHPDIAGKIARVRDSKAVPRDPLYDP